MKKILAIALVAAIFMAAPAAQAREAGGLAGGIVAAVWNTVDGWNGVTTADLRKAAGEQYY